MYFNAGLGDVDNIETFSVSEYACVHFPSKFENTSCNIKLIGIGTSLGGRNNKRAFVPLGSLETLSRPPRDVSKAWYDVPLQWKPINTLFVAAEKWDNVRNYLRFFLRFFNGQKLRDRGTNNPQHFAFFVAILGFVGSSVRVSVL